MASELDAWLLLHRAPGIGPARYRRLLEHFDSPTAVLGASRASLEGFGFASATLDFLQHPDDKLIGPDLAWLEQSDNYLLTWQDERYPPLLRDIAQAPPLLYVHGDPEILILPQLAIVGTRNPTPNGERTAHDFAEYLSQTGLIVSSGLAQGIDAAAHRGSLQGSHSTVAVMGTGLDRVYPASHRALAHEIAERGGALVSELPIGTPALAEHFPRRNRIISGMSLGVLVVEAALQSGSLITAQLAVEQGREVFAIPGSIHNPQARGCHSLIRQGAKLVETATDILEELGPLLRRSVQAVDAKPPCSNFSDGIQMQSELSAGGLQLDDQYQLLLDQLGSAPVAVDTLVERCGLTADAVSSMLLILELHGYVAAKPGGLYFRVAIEGH